jgi:hypothetical protein
MQLLNSIPMQVFILEVFHFFNFILGGYGYNLINNFKYFYGYDYLSIAANSYIKSTEPLIMSFIKKTMSIFRQILQMWETVF